MASQAGWECNAAGEIEGGLPDLPYGGIRAVFTDLDGTLYPGAYEQEPDSKEKRGLIANMAEVERLEGAGFPVVPATGNNVSFAQKKMVSPDGRVLRDLSSSPGIYCNGMMPLLSLVLTLLRG